MTRLGPLPFRVVERGLARLGFRAVRQRGSHVRFVHQDGRSTTVPFHGAEEIGPPLLKRILHDIKVEREAFLRAAGR